MHVPTGVLVTDCVEGCPSQITWEYDEGERTTRDYPGYPESVYPVEGCSEEHYALLGSRWPSASGALGMQCSEQEARAWYLLHLWYEIDYAAQKRMYDSEAYLNGHRPSLLCIQRGCSPHSARA